MSATLGSTRKARMDSGRTEWCTPRVVLECVEAIDAIGLDPCWSPRSFVRAHETLSLEGGNDGLAYPWHSLNAGLVYVNPPYGRALKRWVPKMIAEAEAGCEIVALLPNHTESTWFIEMHEACDAAAAWRGRLTFSGASSPAFVGSALFYFGDRRKRFLLAFNGRAYSIKP